MLLSPVYGLNYLTHAPQQYHIQTLHWKWVYFPILNKGKVTKVLNKSVSVLLSNVNFKPCLFPGICLLLRHPEHFTFSRNICQPHSEEIFTADTVTSSNLFYFLYKMTKVIINSIIMEIKTHS